jgi:hypothetical protein
LASGREPYASVILHRSRLYKKCQQLGIDLRAMRKAEYKRGPGVPGPYIIDLRAMRKGE